MKYIISRFERPQGSPIEYENAQKRILEVFGCHASAAARSGTPRRCAGFSGIKTAR